MSKESGQSGEITLSSRRRLCVSCGKWQGKRRIMQSADGEIAIAADIRGGSCRDGAWRHFSTLPRQTCDEYIRWESLLGLPADPVVLSTTSQLHSAIRMNSHLAAPLPTEMRQRLDDLLWEIESWHIQRQCGFNSKEELEQEWFFNEIISGVFDCFYYVGWSTRKPVSEMTFSDIWPLR